MSDYEVRAVISAKDDGFTSTFSKAVDSVKTLQNVLSGGFNFASIARSAESAMSSVVSSVTGGAKAFDTLANETQETAKSISTADTAITQTKSSTDEMARALDKATTSTDKLGDETKENNGLTKENSKEQKENSNKQKENSDKKRENNKEQDEQNKKTKEGTGLMVKFDHALDMVTGSASQLETRLSGGLGFGFLMEIGRKAFDVISGAVTGLFGELEDTSAAWKTFEKNARMNGHLEGEIKSVKGELQDFAQKTVYGASDMATTWSQLDAVGIDAADDLVRGFGGIAAAAENPQQAMKTLSQQGVQMAAKPTVAWQDFKLMLEQTPAGIAAVAKEMGMSTAEMVTAVQDGQIATEDFFEAIKKVGTNEEFTELATKAKTVGQAMDGLSETVTNTLMPSFEIFQGVGIRAVDAVADAIGGIDAEALAGKVGAFVSIVETQFEHVKNTVKGTAAVLKGAFEQAGIELPGLDDVRNALSDLVGYFDKANVFIRQHKEEIAELVKVLPSLAGAYAALQLGRIFGPNFVSAGKTLGALAGVFGTVAGAAVDFGGKAKGSFKSVSEGVKNVAEKTGNIFDSIRQGAAGKLGGIKDFFGKTFTNIAKFAGDKFGAVKTVFGNAFNGITEKLAPVGEKIGSVFSGIAGKIGGVFGNIGNVIGPALSGIGGSIGQFIGLVGNLGGKLVAGFGKLIGPLAAVGGKIVSVLCNVVLTGGKLFTKYMTTVMGMALKILAPGVLVAAVLVGLGLLYNTFQDQIDNVIALVQTKGPEVITNFVTGITSKIPDLVAKGAELVGKLLDTFTILLPSIINGGVEMIAALAGGLAQAAPTLVPKAMMLVMTLISGIVSNLPRIILTGMQLLAGLAQGIANSLPMMVASAGQMIVSFVKAVIAYGPQILATGVEIIKSLIVGIINCLPIIVEGAKQVGSWIMDTIKNTDWIQLGKDIIHGIVEGVKGGFEFITGAISDAFSGNAAQTAYTGGESLSQNTAQGLEGSSYVMGSAGESSAQTFINGLINTPTGDVTAFGSDIGLEMTDGYGEAMGQMPATTDDILSQVETQMQGGVDMMGGLGSDIVTNISENSEEIQSTVQDTLDSLGSILDDGCTNALTKVEETTDGMLEALRFFAEEAYSAGEDIRDSAIDGMSGGYDLAYEQGSWIGQGLVDGLNDMVGEAWDAAESLAAAADAAIAARAQIGSPSKITDRYGRWIGAGLANGLTKSTSTAARQAAVMTQGVLDQLSRLDDVEVPSPRLSMPGGSRMSLHDEYDYSSEASYTIYVESTLDGRKVGEGTAKYVRMANEAAERREARRAGRNV